jgi:PAS domain S-box-containing protein
VNPPQFEPLRSEDQSIWVRDYAEAILRSVPPLLILDEELRVKIANDSYCKHFAVSASQIEHFHVCELGDGLWNIPALRTLLEEVLLRHSPFDNFEVTREIQTIGRRTFLLSGRPVDQTPQVLLLINDVTERDKSQLHRRSSEIRYRRLFEAARDGILIMDPETRTIIDANPFMSELLGCPHDELLGKELWQIGLLKDEAASRGAFRDLKTRSFIRYQNLPLQNRAGTRHEVEFVTNVYEEDGNDVIQCNIRDITERKRMEDAVLDANNRLVFQAAELERLVAERTRQLRETISELEAFSYSVSHDMRAPLRAMQSYAQFLTDEYGSRLDAQGVNYLQQIMRSSLRLDRLIHDVLSYTKILHAELPMERVDLDRLVRGIIERFPDGQPMKPEIQISGRLPKVMGNYTLLEQCISNLLSNATKFVSPGTTPRVAISAESIEGGSVRISFKDNGIGINAEDHARIFRLFERIHPITEYEGTGIGLTIVRKAIERMDALVGCESTPGEGSNFWIQLKQRMTE